MLQKVLFFFFRELQLINTVVHNCYNNSKETLFIKKISQIEKIRFHINKICSHIQKSICLQMPKNHGKFSLQIPTANSRGK